MERLNNVMEAVKQSHHMPVILSFFMSFVFVKKQSCIFNDEDNAVGDNIPAVLMENTGR